MKSFRQFINEQDQINERLIRKGAVAAYALQGKKHGDQAVSKYKKAKQSLRTISNKESTDMKVDALIFAINQLLDGLISQREQIGSVSAQVTAVSFL